MDDTIVAAVAAIHSIVDLCVNNDRCERATAVGATLGAIVVALLIGILDGIFEIMKHAGRRGWW